MIWEQSKLCTSSGGVEYSEQKQRDEGEEKKALGEMYKKNLIILWAKQASELHGREAFLYNRKKKKKKKIEKKKKKDI